MVFLVVLLTPNAFGMTQLITIPYGASNGNNYAPNQIEIQKDDTVKWVNLDRNTAHTVTSTSGLFDSGELLPNNDENYCYPNCKPSLTYKFDAGGTYKYECKIHSWMQGVVKVIELGQDAEIKIQGYAGDMYIDRSQYEITAEQDVKIKIYGKVKDVGKGDYVIFVITKPDGSISEQRAYVTKSGEYELPVVVTYKEIGTYNVVSTFGIENIGTANFVVVKNILSENLQPPADDEPSELIQTPQNTQSREITIETDFQSYKKGDLIQIHGSVGGAFPNGWKSNPTQLIVQTFDPRNNLVRVDQFFPRDSGLYSVSTYAEGPLWKFEGDYTVKVNFAGEVASTTFALTIPGTPFDSPSPVPSTQSKTSTFLKLDLLDNTFTAQGGPTPLADVTYSGQLLTGDRKSYIPNSEIKLVFTGFTFAGEDHYEMTTDHVGEFDFRVSMPVGEGYGVQAVYDGSSDFKSSKSQTEYFDVRSAPLQPQPPSQPDDNPYAGIAGLLIIVVIIAGIAIGIRGARKKKPKQYQTIGGSGQQQTYQQAPPKPKATWRRKSKQKVQPQAQPDYDIDTNHCLNCGKGFMEKQPNGTKRCNHCSWDPTKH